ncbi:hypothetical protein [Bryobacter aggregatus]|uniref:hypothetical protein n=1 Tax=Bryobacter aggregatus TaxID=360054 RepID=UPI0012BAE4A8|nr:hypothetical protein [Bryobacter aggregatus]
MVSFFSLVLNWALPATYRGTVPTIFRINAPSALAFLLLALSVRLTRWERLDLRSAHRARLARVCAGVAALLTLFDTVLRGQVNLEVPTPVLLAVSHCLLAAVIILQAYGKSFFTRRVLLVVSAVTSVWLMLANLYSVNGNIPADLTCDPAAATLIFLLTLSLCLAETRNGLIPLTVTSVLGDRASVHLFLAAILVPLGMGLIRLGVEQHIRVSPNLMIALHVLATLCVMVALIAYSLNAAKGRFDEQRRLQLEFERGERTFQALLEQGSEVYLTISFAGRVMSCNANAIHYLGLPDVSKKIVCIEDIILPESRDKMRQLPETLLRNLSSNTVLLFRLADGDAMPLFVTAACRMRHGSPEEILLVGRALPLGLRSPKASQSLLALGT